MIISAIYFTFDLLVNRSFATSSIFFYIKLLPNISRNESISIESIKKNENLKFARNRTNFEAPIALIDFLR